MSTMKKMADHFSKQCDSSPNKNEKQSTIKTGKGKTMGALAKGVSKKTLELSG